MTTKNSSGFDMEELVTGIAADINRLSELAAKTGELKSLEDIDFTAILPVSTTGVFRKVTTQLKTRAGSTAAAKQAQASTVSEAIEDSITARKDRLQTALSGLEKSVTKESAKLTDAEKEEAQVILKNITKNVNVISRNIEELQIRKTLKG